MEGTQDTQDCHQEAHSGASLIATTPPDGAHQATGMMSAVLPPSARHEGLELHMLHAAGDMSCRCPGPFVWFIWLTVNIDLLDQQPSSIQRAS